MKKAIPILIGALIISVFITGCVESTGDAGLKEEVKELRAKVEELNTKIPELGDRIAKLEQAINETTGDTEEQTTTSSKPKPAQSGSGKPATETKPSTSGGQDKGPKGARVK